MNTRFPRSTREAFACERFPAIFGPYRPPSRAMTWLGLACTLALCAAIGVLLAWRG